MSGGRRLALHGLAGAGAAVLIAAGGAAVGSLLGQDWRQAAAAGVAGVLAVAAFHAALAAVGGAKAGPAALLASGGRLAVTLAAAVWGVRRGYPGDFGLFLGTLGALYAAGLIAETATTVRLIREGDA